MPVFSIAVDVSAILPIAAPLSRDAFPTLSYAVRQIAEAAHRQWTAYAAGAPLPSGKVIHNRTGEYMRSILLRDTGEFSAEVYSDLPYAQIIEEGAPSRDMKTILNSSLKVRTTKDGRRYLIIPFRFNTPGSVMGNALPGPVHQWWQQGRAASSISGTYRRLSGTGAHDIKTRELLTVPGWKYRWGDRLEKSDLNALGIHGAAAKRMDGMYMFRKPGGAGGSSHTQFLTFRVMMEGSKGWIAPARAGLHPAQVVADQFRPIAEKAFSDAVAADIKGMVGGS